MTNDVNDQVHVVLDQEVEAPILIDARLPETPALIVFLGAEGGMVDCLSNARCTCWGALA